MSVSLLSDLLTGRTTPRATPATHPVGTVLDFQGGYSCHEDAIVLSWNPPGRWNADPEPVVAVASHQDGTAYAEPAKVWHRQTISGALVHPYGERRGIGYYEAAGDCETCAGRGQIYGGPAPETCPVCSGTGGSRRNVGEVEVARLSALLDRLEAEHAAKQAAASAKAERLDAIGAALAPDLLGNCPALIVAEYRVDDSDAQTDYSGHHTARRVILAKSDHKRHLFPEFRKAARTGAASVSTLTPEDRAALLAMAEGGEEHRENYSMGGGTFLTPKGKHRDSTGWSVHKVTNYRPETGWTASHERQLLATGDNPWISAERAEELADAKAGKAITLPAAAIVAAAEPEPTPEPATVAARPGSWPGWVEIDRADGSTVQVSDGSPAAQVCPTPAPTYSSPLIWVPPANAQTRTLRAHGLTVDDLRAAGYAWKKTGSAYGWVAEARTPEAVAILARLIGQPDPGGPGPEDGQPAPAAKAEAAPAAPAPAPAPRPAKAVAPDAGRIGKALSLADKLDADADHGERDRETHTPKKLKQAMDARLDAARYRRGAALLREWAADPSRLPDWKPSRDQAIAARAQETQECRNGYHGYMVENGKPRETTDPTLLALRKAYPEGGRTPEQEAAAKLAALIADCRFADWEGFFPTPPALADDIVRRADIRPGMKVLEPSAGMGDLADRCRAAGGKVDVCERVGKLREILAAKGYGSAPSSSDAHADAVKTDCLLIHALRHYDRVVMNPPFEKDQGIDHVMHCWPLLKPGGRLVAILPAGIDTGEGRAKRQAFREWIARIGAVVEPNDPGAFNSREAFRRTGVATVTLIADKAG